MHEICAEVEEVTVTPEPTEDEPDPEPVTQYILHITVSSKSVDALGKGVSTYLMLAPLFAGLAAAGYLILAALYGWKYLVLLRWMNLASSTSSKTSNSVRRRASLG